MMSVPTVDQKYSSNEKMLATCWHGKGDIRVEQHPKPLITEAGDALLRITSTAICGSDLHMYTNFMPGMKKGDVVGHEFMGIIEDVGPNVKNFKKGDRVVAAFDLACGHCFFCKQQQHSCCTNTNPDESPQQPLYGDKTAGMSGYSHITGGYAGGQAEYARVVNADVNLLKVPNDVSVPDERVLFLSDILSTAWHANELGQVSEGDKVAIWGAGPVGMLAARLAQIRGAKQVIMIDNIEYRLKYVQEKVPGVEVINFNKDKDVVKKLKEMTTYGPDVGIEAVGCHYTKSWVHRLETTLMLETDSGDMINEIINAVRKGGRISIVGVYVATINHFNLGAFFEKGMSMAGGQTPCQKYWPKLLELIQSGAIDPSFVISHTLPLEKAADGYKIFNDKQDECIKCVLKPGIKA